MIGAETKDLDDFRVEPIDRALRELDDQVIERRAPALDAAGDFGGQRAVAIVVQAPARERDRRRQVGVAGGDGAEDVVRRDTRGCDHGAAVKRSPAVRRSAGQPLSSGMAASRVFGQGGSFTSRLSNNGGVSANSLFGPGGVALDKQGHLYVADFRNNRVLEYDTPLGANTNPACLWPGGLHVRILQIAAAFGAQSLFSPASVALDGQCNLHVADFDSNRCGGVRRSTNDR